MQKQVDAARERRVSLTLGLLHAFGDDDLDKAQECLDTFAQENGLSQEQEDVVVFRVMIAIQRGRALDALHLMNDFGEDFHPELRALSLFFLRDPLWRGLATELAENSPHENVRVGMTNLLNQRLPSDEEMAAASAA